jgi:hypothetical protein
MARTNGGLPTPEQWFGKKAWKSALDESFDDAMKRWRSRGGNGSPFAGGRGNSPFENRWAGAQVSGLDNAEAAAKALDVKGKGQVEEGLLNKGLRLLDRGKSAVVGGVTGAVNDIGRATGNESWVRNTDDGNDDTSDDGFLDRFVAGARGQRTYGGGDFAPLKMDADDSKAERILKGAGAFTVDVLADPLTYMSLGGSVLGKKGASAIVASTTRSFADDLGEEAAESLAKRHFSTRLAATSPVDEATGEVLEQAATRSTRELAGEQLASEAAEAYQRGGARGLRQYMYTSDELTRDQAEKLWRSVPRDVRGGMRVRVPFAKDERGVVKTFGVGDGGGQIAEQIGLGRALDVANDARFALRASKPVRVVADKVGGQLGGEYGKVISGLKNAESNRFTYGQYDSLKRVADAHRAFTHAMSRSSIANLADIGGTLHGDGIDKGVASDAFRRFFNDRAASANLDADTITDVSERAGLAAAQRGFAVLDDLVAQARAAGMEIQELADYVPRVLDDEMRAVMGRNKRNAASTPGGGGLDPRQARDRNVGTELYVADDGTLQIRFLTNAEVNAQRAADGKVPMFSEDPMEMLAAYTRAMTRAVSTKRFEQLIADAGLAAVVTPTVRETIDRSAAVGAANAARETATEVADRLGGFAGRRENNAAWLDDRVQRYSDQVDELTGRLRSEAAQDYVRPDVMAAESAKRGRMAGAARAAGRVDVALDDFAAKAAPQAEKVSAKVAAVQARIERLRTQADQLDAAAAVPFEQTKLGRRLALELDELSTADAAVAKTAAPAPVAAAPTGPSNAALIERQTTLADERIALEGRLPKLRRDNPELGASQVMDAERRIEVLAAEEAALQVQIDANRAARRAAQDAQPAPTTTTAAAVSPARLTKQTEYDQAAAQHAAKAERAATKRATAEALEVTQVTRRGRLDEFAAVRDGEPVLDASTTLGRRARAAQNRSGRAARQVIDENASIEAGKARQLVSRDETRAKLEARLLRVQDRLSRAQVAAAQAGQDAQVARLRQAEILNSVENLRAIADEVATLTGDAQDDAIRVLMDGAEELARIERKVARQLGRSDRPFDAKSVRAVFTTEATLSPAQVRRLEDADLYRVGTGADRLAARDVSLPTSAYYDLGDMWGSDGVRDFVNNYFTKSSGGALAELMDDVYRPLFSLWKTWATVGRGPGYLARNLIGGLWNNHLLDVTAADHVLSTTLAREVSAARKAARAAHPTSESARRAMINDILVGDNGTLRAVTIADDVTLADAYRVMLDEDLYQSTSLLESMSLGGFRLGDDAIDELVRSGRATSSMFDGDDLNIAQRGMNRAADNAWVNTMAGAARASEEWLRGAAVVSGLRRYGRLDNGRPAALLAKLGQFDYADLSAFERNVMRNLIPFYTWSRNNIPLQLRALLTEPGKINRLDSFNEAMRDTFGMQYDDDGNEIDYDALMPLWRRERLAWTVDPSWLTWLPDSVRPDAPMTLGVESPVTDLNQWLPGRPTPAALWEKLSKQGVSGLNPILKTGIENVAKTDLSTGASWDERGMPAPAWAKALGRLPGAGGLINYNDVDDPRIAAWLASTVRNTLPPLGQIENVVVPGVDAALGTNLAAANRGDRFASSLGSFFGVPVSTLTESQLGGEAKSRLDRLSPQIRDAAVRAGIDLDWLDDAVKTAMARTNNNPDAAGALVAEWIAAGMGRRA